MLGHFKLCSVLAGGVVFFGDTLLGPQVWGIALTLAGVIAYTHIKLDVRGGSNLFALRLFSTHNRICFTRRKTRPRLCFWPEP